MGKHFEYFTIAGFMGFAAEAIFQKKYDWENGEIGGELSCTYYWLNIYFGAYQKIDGDNSIAWRTGGGIGF